MTTQEKNTLYSVLLRLIDEDNELTPTERRDLMNTVTQACCGMTADDILSATENNRKLLIKRGTTAQNDEYTGLSGEITLDTDTNTLRVHDGQTPGGHSVTGGNVPSNQLPENIDYVVEWQTPTAENNYTWYRKYASGWVEQGGIINAGGAAPITVNLPIAMANTNYNIQATCINSLEYWCGSSNHTTTTCTFRTTNRNSEGYMQTVSWTICGYANQNN